MMRTVHIYGSIGKKFGRKYRLMVDSVTEAVRLLCVQIPGLREAIEAGRFKISIGEARGKGILLDNDSVGVGLPAGDIHIAPVVQGGKSGGGIGKIIIGTLLVAASFFVPVGGTILMSLGLSIGLAGVSQLLSPNKKSEKAKRSYMDSGQQTGGQGNCVPITVGRFMTTPLVISAGVSVADSNGLV